MFHAINIKQLALRFFMMVNQHLFAAVELRMIECQQPKLTVDENIGRFVSLLFNLTYNLNKLNFSKNTNF